MLRFYVTNNDRIAKSWYASNPNDYYFDYYCYYISNGFSGSDFPPNLAADLLCWNLRRS